MAIIVYKGKEYHIKYRVTVFYPSNPDTFYTDNIDRSAGFDRISFTDNYKVDRNCINVPLKFMRDFSLYLIPFSAEVMKHDDIINLNKTGGAK